MSFINQLLFLLGSFQVIGITWFLRTTRAMLFWVYLWQLKDYHIGRFLDHFRTEKGKKLLSGPLPIIKVILLMYALILSSVKINMVWQFYALWIFVVSILYILESYRFAREIAKKNLKRPVLTLKTISLIVLLFIIQCVFIYLIYLKYSFYIYWFVFYLLLFDILTPSIATLAVFLVHSLTVLFFRTPTIKKATKRRTLFKNLTVIGIAGSYGKTSTKELLYEILSMKFRVLKTDKHQNSEVGISQTILNELKENHEIFIVEMGAYNKGGIKLLCDIARPKIGIITGVNEQHLSTFVSMENLLSAEGGKELVDSLPENGKVFLNEKNKYCQDLYSKTKINKQFYGRDANLFWEENLDGAIAVARELGMTEKEIKLASQNIQNSIPGMEIKKSSNGKTIINSTYSANPDGVMAHLDYLNTFSGKKIIIMPCLIELGNASKEVHKRIGEKIGKICDLAIVTTREQFQAIKKAAIAVGMNQEKIICIDNLQEIIKATKPYSDKDSVILLEGRIDEKIIKFLTR